MNIILVLVGIGFALTCLNIILYKVFTFSSLDTPLLILIGDMVEELGLKIKLVETDTMNAYSPERDELYLAKKVLQENSTEGMAILSHEIFHVLQKKNQSQAYQRYVRFTPWLRYGGGFIFFPLFWVSIFYDYICIESFTLIFYFLLLGIYLITKCSLEMEASYRAYHYLKTKVNEVQRKECLFVLISSTLGYIFASTFFNALK